MAYDPFQDDDKKMINREDTSLPILNDNDTLPALQDRNNLTLSEKLQSLPDNAALGRNKPLDIDALKKRLGIVTSPEEENTSFGFPADVSQNPGFSALPTKSNTATKNITTAAAEAGPVQTDKVYSDPELEAAQKQKREDEGMAMMAKSASIIGNALAGQGHISPDKNTMDMFDQYLKLSGSSLNELLQKRQQADAVMRSQQLKADLDTDKEKADPNSEVSRLYRQTIQGDLKKLGIPAQGFDKMSAAQLNQYLPVISARLAREEAAKLRADAMQERQTQQKLNFTEKQKEAVDKKTKKLSDTIEKTGLPQVQTTLDKIDEILSKPENKKDIPGYGVVSGTVREIPLVGSIVNAASSADATDLRQAIQNLANITLKDRSGAAVTDAEYKRFQQEFANGAFKTEKQLKQTLDRYKTYIEKKKQNLAAGAAPEVIEEYVDRGGDARLVVPKADGTKSTSKPKTVIQNGHTYTLNEKTGEYE